MCSWRKAYQTLQQPWNILEYHSLPRWTSQMAISAQKTFQEKATHVAANSQMLVNNFSKNNDFSTWESKKLANGVRQWADSMAVWYFCAAIFWSEMFCWKQEEKKGTTELCTVTKIVKTTLTKDLLNKQIYFCLCIYGTYFLPIERGQHVTLLLHLVEIIT